MTRSTDRRKTEFLLLIPVLFVVLCGLTLVFLGKRATTPYPTGALNVNAATAAQLAQKLAVSAATAKQLISLRERSAHREWASVYAVRRALKNTPSRPIGDEFVARTPADVARGFWGGVAVFLLAFVAAHLILRKAAPRADPFLLPLVAFLSGVGLMMVYTVKDPYRDTFAFTGQVWAVAGYGMVALILPLTRPFARLNLRRYQYAYALASIGLMLLLLVAGNGPGGIHIRLFGFEPVEFIKILLVFFVVSYLSERRIVSATRLRDFAPLLVIYAFTLLLFVLVKDLGPAVLLFGTFLALLFLATNRPVFPLIGVTLLLAAAFVGDALHVGFFATRVTMWLHPWANADPRGSQLAQGLWGMATGGIFGSGLGLGSPNVMPRAGSDLIFATVGEELGLFGTLAILTAYTVIGVRGFALARTAQTDFERLLAAGLTTLLTLQAMIIIGGVTGLLPLTGITLPFVSFGGSSLTANFLLVGLLLSISNNRLPDTARDEATPEWTRAARLILTAGLTALLLGVGKLVWVQSLTNRSTATRAIRTPDGDGVIRPHVNPRLLEYAAAIPRGRILDRNGKVLARDANGSELGGTGLLTTDGRRRIYTHGESCAHLLVAVEGPGGASNALGQNGKLRGWETYQSLLPYYLRRNLPFPAHLRGEDVTLTLDADLQQTALESLQKHSVKGRAAAVVLDVATGDILAAPSLPTFDLETLTPEKWADLLADKAKNAALLNRAVNGLYPPGSTFKIVTAASALTHGLENQTFFCRHTDTDVVWKFGGKTYARKRVTDEEGFIPHGRTDMAKAIKVSCNVYFAHLGIALGADALEETARSFGLAHLPSLQKLGEDLPDCAYGQGAVLTTPLEMARVAAAVANDGVPPAVSFVKNGVREKAAATVLTPGQSHQLQQMLASVTTDGTARGVFDGLPFSVAGKTGSAQNSHGISHSWFVGFAPGVRPTLAFSCIVENGGFGRSAAAPVCRDILRKAL